MNNTNKLIVGVLITVAVVVAGIAVYWNNVHLAGDFAGGIQPSQVFTCNAGTNSCTPNLSNLYVNGAISVGGTAAANQTVLQYTGSMAFPTSVITLGGFAATTSTTSTSLSVPVGGFSIGDPCSEIFYNGASSTAPLLSYDANITAVSGANATATVVFFNAAASSVTFNTTSSATGASSTLKATCRHAGV